MKYRTRTYYTDGQKALMWERRKEGWRLHQIAHLFNRAHTSVRGVLAQTGGIRSPQRSRSGTRFRPADAIGVARISTRNFGLQGPDLLTSNASRSAALSAPGSRAGLRCFSTSAATFPTAVTAALNCSVVQPYLFDHSRTE